MGGPETTEEIEAEAEYDAKDKTDAVAADGIKTEPPVVEDETADHALYKVVTEAHLADALKVRNGFLHTARSVV